MKRFDLGFSNEEDEAAADDDETKTPLSEFF